MTTLVDMRGTAPWPVLKAAGYDGAFGYSGHNRDKCPDPGYGESLVAAGGLYLIIFEDQANRPLDGYSAGRADAIFANLDADEQSYPPSAAIYWAADFDAAWGDIKEYARGWAENTRRPTGLYGNGEVIRAAKAVGYAAYGWRTCSGGFRGSKDFTGIDLVQMCQGTHVTIGGERWEVIPVPGHSVDTNRTLPGVTDIGAWGQTAKPHPPTPNPEELTMADIAALTAQLNAIQATQKAQGDKLDALYQDYGVSREPMPGKAGDNGSKRYQIGKTYLKVVKGK